MTPKLNIKQKTEYQLTDLIEIMSALRDPETGCPWDLKQTFKSIVPHTLEEAYEVADAIENNDLVELKLELGDLLFQVIFYSQLAKEQKIFDMNDVISGVCEKLIRRHPHVFGDQVFTDEAQIKANWEAEKAQERAAKSTQTQPSVLDDVPKSMPALSRAIKLQKRCANVGFDWPDALTALDKVKEEIAELEAELAAPQPDQARIGEELGDLMFALTNINRHIKQDAETTLRQANRKFEKRFRQVEILAAQQNKLLEDMSLAEMESLWQQVKKQAG